MAREVDVEFVCMSVFLDGGVPCETNKKKKSDFSTIYTAREYERKNADNETDERDLCVRPNVQ